jgi:hypothetical protein
VNSAFVTGAGPTTFTGPAMSSRSSRNVTAASQSASEIHGSHWRPLPIRPAMPSRNGNSCGLRKPPSRCRAYPVRSRTTRTPALSAGPVAASQTRHMSARKPSPAGASSVTSRSPVSPYQPIALAFSSTPGRSSAGRPAIAAANVPVLSTRLVRSRFLYASVHRRSPTPAPDRLITAVTPDNVVGSSWPAAGSHRISSADLGGRRTSRTISWPAALRWPESRVPRKPDEPAMRIRM